MGFPRFFCFSLIVYVGLISGVLGTQSQWYGSNQVAIARTPPTDQKLLWGIRTPSPLPYLPPPSNNFRECQSQEVAEGRFKVICGGPGPTVHQEHIFWLQSGSTGSQFIDIEVPNYAIREIIKAGYKPGVVGGSTINVLLKRPQSHVDAQVEHPKTVVGAPKVNIQYERPQSKVIHFPVDQRYSTLQGPIMPPLAISPPQSLTQSYGYST